MNGDLTGSLQGREAKGSLKQSGVEAQAAPRLSILALKLEIPRSQAAAWDAVVFEAVASPLGCRQRRGGSRASGDISVPKLELGNEDEHEDEDEHEYEQEEEEDRVARGKGGGTGPAKQDADKFVPHVNCFSYTALHEPIRTARRPRT